MEWSPAVHAPKAMVTGEQAEMDKEEELIELARK
jgi:hypothetical protein